MSLAGSKKVLFSRHVGRVVFLLTCLMSKRSADLIILSNEKTNLDKHVTAPALSRYNTIAVSSEVHDFLINRFVKKVYELDPSTTGVPWQPRGYVSKRKNTESSQTEIKPKKICTPLLENEVC